MTKGVRWMAGVSLAMAIAGSIVTGTRADQAPPGAQADAGRFVRVPTRGPIASSVKPRALDETMTKVVVVFGGDSVAAAQERAGRRLTRAEKNAIKSQRAAEQAAARASLVAAGGRVEGAFQSALNGVKVRIPRNRVESLRRISGVVDVRPVGVYRHENVVSVPRIQAPFAWSGANGSTILLPVLASSIGITAANPRLSYTAVGFDRLSNDSDAFTETAAFNAFHSAISNGDFVIVDPNAFVSVSVAIDFAEAAITPAKGLMIVTQDNKNGPREADLINVRFD
jgi:hypothetical protein